jgi:hypothetical protein
MQFMQGGGEWWVFEWWKEGISLFKKRAEEPRGHVGAQVNCG